VIEGGRLAALLRKVSRKVVLELTEHAAVDDYPAARAAIDRIRPLADVAIDDAGAGFASLRHILELRPNLVKLDASLTRGIESDPLRQALIAGLVHFAGTAGFALLGEAIETEPEAAALYALGVEYGQGYLFGRPAPIDRWAIRETSARPQVLAGALHLARRAPGSRSSVTFGPMGARAESPE
jgi:EAL domain-containing protein (putative c-di-GMP-specific phosphodiesterase class I)